MHDLTEELARITRELEKRGIDYALRARLAMAVYSAPPGHDRHRFDHPPKR